MHERVLSLLACRYADDVALAAPWVVTDEFMRSAHVSVVVTGNVNPYKEVNPTLPLEDPFAVPRAQGSLKVVSTDSTLTMDNIADRIVARAEQYFTRQQKQAPAEKDFLANRDF